LPDGVHQMTEVKTAVDYALLKDLKKAHKAGVFEDIGVDNENEKLHVSELEYRLEAFDEKETYIAVKTLVRQHRKTVVNTLEYLNKEKEGEKKECDS